MPGLRSISHLSLALLLGLLFAVALAAPAAAASTGTICGQVTGFVAPSVIADGSITVDGTTDVIDSSAAAGLAAGAAATLTVIASLDGTTCLAVEAGADGSITGLDIAAEARVCGTALVDSLTGLVEVDGVAVTDALLAANANLSALLDAAADATAAVCLDLDVDSGSGVIGAARLDASLTLCGTVSAITADSATLRGVAIPQSALDADARAALQLAANANAGACAEVTVTDTDTIAASVDLSVDVCGAAALTAAGDAALDGTAIPAELLDADAQAVLELAAAANGDACASIDVASTGGSTTATAVISARLCATLTAIGDGTVTLGGVTVATGADAAAGLQVGDRVCALVGTSPGGGVQAGGVVRPGQPLPAPSLAGGRPATTGAGAGGGALPDTAVASLSPLAGGLGSALLVAAWMGMVLRRRQR